jgi:hypothetical protein
MSGLTPGSIFYPLLYRQPRIMPLPPFTDLLALLGLDLVLCATGLWLWTRWRGVTPLTSWAVLACLVMLWIPAGAAQLPLLAYARGVSSDLSTTLVALAGCSLAQRLFNLPAWARRERMAVSQAVALAAALLYPLALGWGNWDAYRLGWGSFGMLGGLLVLCAACWVRGLRLLPALVGLALLAWVGGLMESSNLWDYLMDPWLALLAVVQCAKAGALRSRRQTRPSVRPLPP